MGDDTFEQSRNALLVEGKWQELVELLEAESQEMTGDALRDCLEELGSIYLEHLDDPRLAYAAWERMFRAGGDEQMVATYCGQILEQHPDFEPALLRLDPALRSVGTEEALKTLVGHYLDVSDACDDATAFLAYREKAASIFEDDLGQIEGAYLVLSTAIRPDTFNRAMWERLLPLARTSKQELALVESVFDTIMGLSDTPATGELLKPIGFFAMEIHEDDRAVALLRRAASIRSDPQIREALTLLYQKRGEWDGVLEDLEEQMDRAVDHVHRKELFEKYVSMLERAATETAAPYNAKWYSTLGHVAVEHQHDRPTAIRYWEQALVSDPNCVPAIEPLIDEYLSALDWESAQPLLETYCDIASKQSRVFDPRDTKRRLLQLAELYRTLKKPERAADTLRRVYEIDPDDPEAMLRYGEALAITGAFETASRVLRRLIVEFPTSLSPTDNALALRLGAKLALSDGQFADARTWIVRSLELEPRDLDAHRTLHQVGLQTKNHDFSLRALERLAADSPDPAEQFKSRADLGDVWAEMGRPDRASESYESALALQPNSILVLRKLLELFKNAKQWASAITVLERLSANELDASKRATMSYTMAILARDELRDSVHAVQYFDAALDDAPSMLKAFEAIDRILTDARAWKELERAYRRMLTRLEHGDPDLLFLLWKSLGEVYRTRLGNAEDAIACFETALSLKDDESARLILADLYQRTGLGGSSAVEQLSVVLDTDVRRFDTLEAIYSAHLNNKNFDGAFNVAAVLQAFDAAGYDVGSFYNQYLGRNLKLAKSQFYPELLDAVYHESMDRFTSAIMSIVCFAVRGPLGRTRKEWGVAPSHKADPNKPQSRFEKMFWYIARLVGPGNFELYIRRDHALGFRNMQTDPPALLVGNDMLEPTDDRRFAFEFGKLLSGLRPELYLGSGLYTVENLNLFFVSAVDFAIGRKPRAGRDGASMIKHIKALPGPMKMQLKSFVSQIDTNEVPDLSLWLTAVEHTTSRFGYLVCGDLQTAFRCMKEQASPPTYATLNERLDDLARFCISEKNARVRKELGIGL